MAYPDNRQYQNDRNASTSDRKGNRSDRPGNRENNGQKNKYETRQYDKVKVPLHTYYKDKADELLVNGTAYKIANDFKNIPPHQLRKPLDQSKQAMTEIHQSADNFDLARNRLFAMVPMAAYNAGRDRKKLMVLYKFIQSHINLDSIKSVEDIETFDELMTAIVAYHKLLTKLK